MTDHAVLQLRQTLQSLELSGSLAESRVALQRMFAVLGEAQSDSLLQASRDDMAEIIQRTWLVLETVATYRKQVRSRFEQLTLQGLEQKWALVKDSCAQSIRTCLQNIGPQAYGDPLMAKVSAQYKTLILIEEFWRLYADALAHC